MFSTLAKLHAVVERLQMLFIIIYMMTGFSMADNAIRLKKIMFYVEQDYSFDILLPLAEEAASRGIKVLWFVCGTAKEHTNIEIFPITRSIKVAVDFLPDAVFAPGNHVPSFISGLKVQVFHGLSQDKRGNEYPERGMFDMYCTEGQQRTAMLSKHLHRGYFTIAETGWVKTDRILNFKTEVRANKVPVILYASTFTPKLSSAEYVFDKLRELYLSGTYAWLFTLHPKMNSSTKKKYIDMAGSDYYESCDVISLLHHADILVSDNSSIIQEFLMLGKPVVTVNNINPTSVLINVSDVADLKPSIDKALRYIGDSSFHQKAKNYISAITPHADGKVAPRILDAVEEKIKSGWVDSKPLNIKRNLKLRWQLKYFCFWK